MQLLINQIDTQRYVLNMDDDDVLDAAVASEYTKETLASFLAVSQRFNTSLYMATIFRSIRNE